MINIWQFLFTFFDILKFGGTPRKKISQIGTLVEKHCFRVMRLRHLSL
jgi:hypothetical protein